MYSNDDFCLNKKPYSTDSHDPMEQHVPSTHRVGCHSQHINDSFFGVQISYPILTKKEEESHLGVWLDQTISLLSSLSDQVIQEQMERNYDGKSCTKKMMRQTQSLTP